MILCSLFQDIQEGPEKDQCPGKYKAAYEDPGGPGQRTQIGFSRGLGLHHIQMVKAGHNVKKPVHVGIVNGLLPPDRFGHAFDELARCVPERGGSVEHRSYKGISGVGKEQPGCLDLYFIKIIVILPGPGKIVLVFR